MTTYQQEAYLSSQGLLWGIFWRSVLWYTATGMVLGGLYGCAFVAVAMFSLDASEAIEPSEVWGVRAMVVFFGAAGFVAGWALARAMGREMRPLLGAVIGAMVGIPLGGFYFLFAYMFALPVGAVLGGTYGLALGLVDALLVAVLTRALFFPLSEPRLYRRTVVLASLLGVLIVPAYWFVALMRSSGYQELGSMTGFIWGDIFVYAGFPPLVLVLVAQWIGGRLAGWYEHAAPRTSDTAEEPTLRQVLRREKRRRIAYLAIVLAAFAVLAVLAAGARLYQTRMLLTHIRSTEAVLSQDGDRAAVLSPRGFAVYSVPDGRRLHALSLSRAETYDVDSAVWNSNGRFLATSDGERVHVYDAAEGMEATSLPIAAAQLAWSPDGSLLAVSTMEGTYNPFVANSEARIWSRDSRSWTHTLSVGEVASDPDYSCLVFDTNGHTLAATTDSGVQLWDTSRGQLLRKLRPSDADGSYFAAYSAAFSPDGELVASGGWGRVNVWRTRDGELLWSTETSGRQVLALAFSSDGDMLISGGMGRAVQVWQTREGTRSRRTRDPRGASV